MANDLVIIVPQFLRNLVGMQKGARHLKFSGLGYAGSCRHVFLLLPTKKNSLFIMAQRLPKMFQSQI